MSLNEAALAKWSRQDEDCQLWKGPKTSTGHPLYGNKAVHPYVAETAGIPVMHGVPYYTACERRECIEPKHLVHPSTEVGKMLFIKSKVYPHKQTGCLVWTGEAPEGTPIMTWRINKVPCKRDVRRFVYRLEWNLDEDWSGVVSLRPSCDPLCVEATHMNRESEVVVGDSDDFKYDAV